MNEAERGERKKRGGFTKRKKERKERFASISFLARMECLKERKGPIWRPGLKRRQPQLLRRIYASKLETAFAEISGNSRSITRKEGVGDLARYLGLSPSEKEISVFFENVKGVCDLAAFRRFCSLLVHKEDKDDSFRQFFLLYDRAQKGCVKKKVLRMIYMNLGETFSIDEWNAFERIFGLSDKSEEDLIPYEPIIDRLLDLD
ncbi:myosin light chain mlc4 [Cystoisospora suis]|uniref:Myosin light chain mlc4 n=1 Tax=Cystoisospora suis TaxID=483139 RepID=A0A2C6LEA2_9APIC|nr:myosin light chain mlc4 [Cystoisospora suis]